MAKFKLVFDEVILGQLQKAARNKNLKVLLKKMLDKIEDKGLLAGELLDPRISLFEVKYKRPPIRLYYSCDLEKMEAYIYEFEMKTSEKKQQSTINRLRQKLSKNRDPRE